jgi:hypothetical protein
MANQRSKKIYTAIKLRITMGSMTQPPFRAISIKDSVEVPCILLVSRLVT